MKGENMGESDHIDQEVSTLMVQEEIKSLMRDFNNRPHVAAQHRAIETDIAEIKSGKLTASEGRIRIPRTSSQIKTARGTNSRRSRTQVLI
jgi:hypothetical protein